MTYLLFIVRKRRLQCCGHLLRMGKERDTHICFNAPWTRTALRVYSYDVHDARGATPLLSSSLPSPPPGTLHRDPVLGVRKSQATARRRVGGLLSLAPRVLTFNFACRWMRRGSHLLKLILNVGPPSTVANEVRPACACHTRALAVRMCAPATVAIVAALPHPSFYKEKKMSKTVRLVNLRSVC